MQGRGYDQGFHEIHQISPWNLADLTCEIQWISPRFHLWNHTQNYKSKCFSKKLFSLMNAGWGISPLKSGGFHPEIWWISTHEIWQISPRFHLWNPPKIIKASVSAKTLQFDECRVGAMTKDFMKSTRFHPEIWWISPMKSGRFHPDFTCEIHPNYKSKCFSKNSSVWWMQGRGYDQGFHEIHQISPWNLADLTCEIQWISTRYHLWNPPKIIKASVSAKTLQFDECRVGDFTHEIWQISPRFDLWNPPKIIKASVSAKTLQFDECRVGDFTLEIWWISPWNLVDFNPWNLVDFTQISPVKSTQNYKSKCFSKNSSVWWMQGGGFHPWNLADFTQISPVKSTQNYKSKCFSKNSSVWWMQGGGFHPWNLADFTQISPVKSTQNYKSKCFSKKLFSLMNAGWGISPLKSGGFHPEIWWISTHEIWQISPRFHLWNPPKIIKASVSAKTLQFDECRVGAMTKDFMKSTRFHPEIWWISPVKSSRVHPDFIYEIHPKS